MSKDRNLAALNAGREICAKREFDRLGEMFAENVVDHDPAEGQASGLEGIKQYWRSLGEAFPDFELDVDLALVDDDYITVGYLLTGTHQGEYLGHAPTGKHFEARSLQVGRCEDGLIVERWGCTDIEGILSQLGLAR